MVKFHKLKFSVKLRHGRHALRQRSAHRSEALAPKHGHSLHVRAISGFRLFRFQNELTIVRSSSILLSCWLFLGNGDGNERSKNEIFYHIFYYKVNRTSSEVFKPI